MDMNSSLWQKNQLIYESISANNYYDIQFEKLIYISMLQENNALRLLTLMKE